MIERILRFSIFYPAAVIVLVGAAALYGLFEFSRLPIDAVPDITNNQVQINALVPGYSPSQVEKQVTYVIETALSGIPGLEMTRSLSRNAFSQVTAIFDDSVNIYFARQQINERLNEIKENLPFGAEVKMGPISTGLGEIYMWTLDFEKDDEQPYFTPEGQWLKTKVEKASYLRTIQDWVVKPQMKGIPGLAGVDSIGGYVRQYHVEPNLEQMVALGLTFQDIIEAIEKNNVSIGPGYIERNGESFLIKSDERIDALPQIGAIVVTAKDGASIRISDIATVSIGKELRTGSATSNGHEAVIGTAMMLIGANSRTVADAVDKKLQEIKSSIPPGIKLETVLNRTKLVDATIYTVVKNLAEGALLVILVLFLFLGQFRAAFITALVIPCSILLTSIGMMHGKISGNLMSLGAIDFGLIVDGAVIITENCMRRLGKKPFWTNQERKEEILQASKEMIKPTVFGQLIIITVYIPILTLSGVEGKMFHPMALTVIIALVSAFILSLTFVPAMLSVFVKGSKHENKDPFLKKIYHKTLTWVFQYPLSTVGLGVASFAMAMILFLQLGEEFVPTLDEKDIAMHAIRIPSTSITQSTAMQEKVEKALLTFPEVDYVFSKTGTAEMASDPMPPNVSDTFIFLKPDPYLVKHELIEKIQETLSKVPGNNYEFTQPIEMRFNELISGVRSDVAVQVYGDDFNVMQQTAEEIARILNEIPGAADVKVAQTEGLPVMEVKFDREAASRLGINVSEGLDVISVAAGGGKAGFLFEGDRRFDIFVRLSETERADVTALNRLPVPVGSNYIPLEEIAALSFSDGLNEVQRENGKRYVSVEANVRGTDLGSFVETAKKEIRNRVSIPKGYWIEWGGQFENLVSARNTLMVVVPICLSLIFILLYMAFNSVKEALVVFTGVPLALSGGILALWLRDMPFSISAAVGFIALSGIAVLNGLVLISSLNELMKECDPEEAILKGALIRLRPVLMTALVASLGFVPMALATGTGAEVQKPLATVVIGGLISSTLLTLIVLPALFKLFLVNRRKEIIVH